MYIVEHVLGSTQDPTWQNALAGAQIDELELNQWDAQKNRLRRSTRQGRTMAVSLERGSFLHDGDILWWDADAREAVICRIRLCEVMVINLQGLKCLPPAVMVERCVALGHALGNQHWPAVVQDEQIFVPLSVDKKVMDSVMRTHHVDGIRYSFVPGSQIADALAPAQVRRLFGGSEQPFHSHGHTHGHPHVHTHAHGHSHIHFEDEGHHAKGSHV